MTHIPGPWVAYTYAINKNLCTVCADDQVICNVVDGNLANAILIAAAPALLEACKAIVAAERAANEELNFQLLVEATELVRAALVLAEAEGEDDTPAGSCATCNSTGDCPECAGSGKCHECGGTGKSTVITTGEDE